MSGSSTRVRLLLADEGSFREVDIDVPSEAIGRYERLIDLLQEEPAVLRVNYVDLARLCSAQVLDEDGGGRKPPRRAKP